MSSANSTQYDTAGVQENSAQDVLEIKHIQSSDFVSSPSSRDNIANDEVQLNASKSTQKVEVPAPTAITRPNRFSISFPIQPAPLSTSARAHSPEQPGASPSTTEAKPPSVPTDTNFLTAIAAQERRVLELKEELVRAEADLVKLKRQWAQHEVQKKRDDAKKVTKLQDLQTASPVRDKEDDGNGSSAWMQAEMERRKALMNQSRPAGRTIFAGSKHTRALSLLSSASNSDIGSSLRNQHPARADSLSHPKPSCSRGSSSQIRPLPMTRASITIDPIEGPANIGSGENSIDGEILMKTGKKMASDFRDGLWTFWEDLRQATVGEEAATTTAKLSSTSPHSTRSLLKQTPLRKDSRHSLIRSSSKSPSNNQVLKSVKTPKHTTKPMVGSALADPSFWTEHGLALPTTPTTVKKSLDRQLSTYTTKDSFDLNSQDDSGWENWDDASNGTYSANNSPLSNAGSEAATVATTVSQGASPRFSRDLSATGLLETSTSEYALPWPTLTAFGSEALRRTASHLASEWEESVDSPLRHEFTGGGDYLGEATNVSTTITRTKKS